MNRMELLQKEYKQSFNYPGLMERSIPVASEIINKVSEQKPESKDVVETTKKKLGRPRKDAVSSDTVATKRKGINAKVL